MNTVFEQLFANRAKDFPEDAEHENGNYFCICGHCNEAFTGYKRRVCCKECESKLEPPITEDTDSFGVNENLDREVDGLIQAECDKKPIEPLTRNITEEG